MAQTNLLQELFEAKAHVGHKRSRVHPKAKPFIYTIEQGISIIDLTKTAEKLEDALSFVKGLAQDGKNLLVVATKKLASGAVAKKAEEMGVHFITAKWPAGLITNFKSIQENIKKMETMLEEKASGAWDKYVKHEQIALNKQLNRLLKTYGGLRNLKKLPDALFVIDTKKEKNAVKEAKDMGIPVIGITDTNTNPYEVHFPIPANDDALSAVEYISEKVLAAYSKHKKTKEEEK